MNFKKIYFLVILIQSLFFFSHLLAGIKVIVQINDSIITDYDIKKEVNYLKILNPNFQKLTDDQKFNIAKNYLIDQTIKKKETEILLKGTDKVEKQILSNYLRNIYSNLYLNSEQEFENFLLNQSGYSLSEIKEKIRIDLAWNEFIYIKYKDQVKIDKDKILKKVNNTLSEKTKIYLISEIVFKKKKNISIEQQLDEIKLSIDQIGFNNTANIYSISESSKLGGNIGWVSELSLSQNIIDKIKFLKKNEYSDLIKIDNNFLLLKVEDIKYDEILNNKEEEINKLINLETNRQLNKFSQTYFNKSKLNYSINEK